MSDAWHYVENGAQTGPVSYEQLRKFLLSPRGGSAALVWHKGFPDWKLASDVKELAEIFEGPPPIPVPHAAPAAAMTASESASMPGKERFFGKNVLGIGAWIVGAAVGVIAIKVFGAILMWPAVLIGITWLILAKCKIEKAAVPMLAFVIGHTGWLVVGNASLYATGNLKDVWFLLDVVLVVALSTWFLLARSRAAAAGILVYQILVLGIGLSTMSEISIPTLSSQALALGQTMHIILRIIGIGLSIYAVAKFGKDRLAETR